jgi:hypothetical protein
VRATKSEPQRLGTYVALLARVPAGTTRDGSGRLPG